MEIKVLKELFREGLLKYAKIVPAPMESDRWLLVFEKVSGGYERITKARSDDQKVYKRINGAIADAQEIGFRKVSLEFDTNL